MAQPGCGVHSRRITETLAMVERRQGENSLSKYSR
jgi:hypothetical protein